MPSQPQHCTWRGAPLPVSPLMFATIAISTIFATTSAFVVPSNPTLTTAKQQHLRPAQNSAAILPGLLNNIAKAPSSSALHVWWFGGTEGIGSDVNQDGDSCELVAVRIERTSANSRKIAGEITVPTPLSDVWAILTDYDRLAIHVPNLVESNILARLTDGQQGDGNFRCRLYQKGAQNIVGFQFAASVTMEMTEQIVASRVNSDQHQGEVRKIGFKCVDSFFFSGFDGEWRAKERVNSDGEVETIVNYSVDVRPKGPVPVAALEWQIREEVPTNLRAVKKAATEVGEAGVLAARRPAVRPRAVASAAVRPSTTVNGAARRTVAPRRTGATVRNGYNGRVNTSNGAVTASRNGVNGQVAKRNGVDGQSAKRSGQAVSAANSKLVVKRNGVTANGQTANLNGVSKRTATNGQAASRNGMAKRTTTWTNAARSRLNTKLVRKSASTPAEVNNQKELPFNVSWDTDETMAAYLGE